MNPIATIWRSCRPLLGLIAIVCFSLTLATSALADEGTLTLKTGEVLQVEILDLEFGRLVNVKFEDGTVKTIKWEEIADLKVSKAADKPVPEEDVKLGEAAAPVDMEEEDSDSAVVVAPPPSMVVPPPTTEEPVRDEATQPKSHGLSKYERLQVIEGEIEDLDSEMPSIAGPVVMTAIGLGLAASIAVHAAATSEVCSQCDLSAHAVLGITSAAVGIFGIALVGIQQRKREPYAKKIENLKTERNRLRAELHTSSRGAYGTLTWSF